MSQCPGCKASGPGIYVGLTNVECIITSCKYFSQKAYDMEYSPSKKVVEQQSNDEWEEEYKELAAWANYVNNTKQVP